MPLGDVLYRIFRLRDGEAGFAIRRRTKTAVPQLFELTKASCGRFSFINLVGNGGEIH